MDTADLKQREADALGLGLSPQNIEAWGSNILMLIGELTKQDRQAEKVWWMATLANVLALNAKVCGSTWPAEVIREQERAILSREGALVASIKIDDANQERKPDPLSCSPNTLVNARRNCMSAPL